MSYYSSEKKSSSSSSSGIGFCGLLTVAFIVLKLCGIISWSWVWVLSPLWIGTIVAILFVVGTFYFIWRLDHPKPKKKKE